jgi:hypothetical protein
MNRFASQARRLITSRGYATATKSTEDFPAESKSGSPSYSDVKALFPFLY